jgi:hypothetical protein
MGKRTRGRSSAAKTGKRRGPDLRRVSLGRIGHAAAMPLATQAIVEDSPKIGRPGGGAGTASTHDMTSRSR